MDHARKLQYAEFFAQLQSSQDLLAERLGVCLVLVDSVGNEITLPSGLPLVCNQHKNSTECHAEFVAQLGADGECIMQRCPLDLHVAVLETSIRTDDGSVYLLAGRTRSPAQAEEPVDLLRSIYTLPFRTPSAKRKGRRSAKVQQHAAITPQERKVLAYIVTGLTNKDIADRLCISHSTVKAHVANLFKKLNLSNRTEASVYALKNGIRLDDESV